MIFFFEYLYLTDTVLKPIQQNNTFLKVKEKQEQIRKYLCSFKEFFPTL